MSSTPELSKETLIDNIRIAHPEYDPSVLREIPYETLKTIYLCYAGSQHGDDTTQTVIPNRVQQLNQP